jgi:hypothetical protein
MYNRAKEKLSLLPVTTVSVSSETLSIPVGAIGVVVEVQFASRPILASNGSSVGGLGDTSIVFGTGTCFTTEVAPNESDSALANGEYWVDYAAGILHGRKATNATSDTASYKTLSLLSSDLYNFDAVDNLNDILAVVQKPLAVSTYTPSKFQNLGANATLNVKATSGNVFAVKCHNINAAARYLQLHNTATTPGGGAVPFLTFLIPASSERVIGAEFFSSQGIHFDTGIAFAFSTTEATYTAGTAAEQMTDVIYK